MKSLVVELNNEPKMVASVYIHLAKRFTSVRACAKDAASLLPAMTSSDLNRAEESHFFQRICCQLKASYVRQFSLLPPLPWYPKSQQKLEHVFVAPSATVSTKRETGWVNEGVLEEVDVPAIFALLSELATTSLPSVLVEGAMGLGKTTLCRRVLVDWATAEHSPDPSLIPFSKNVRCVLHVEINDERAIANCSKNLDANTTQEKLLSCFPGNIDKSLILDELERHEEKVMILIDVERMTTSCELLLDLVNEILPRAKFVFFCRAETSTSLSTLVCAKLTLLDFRIDQTESLLQRYSPNLQTWSQVQDTLREYPDVRRLCGNPLLCSAIFQNPRGIHEPFLSGGQTSFVRKLIEFVWNRYILKSGKHQGLSRSLVDLDTLLASLSPLAMKCLNVSGGLSVSELQSFGHHSLLVDSGLVTARHCFDSTAPSDIAYVFLDRCVMEYVCAVGFVELLLSASSARHQHIPLLRQTKWHNVCRYMAGVLRSDAEVLLKELSVGELHTTALVLLCDCLWECERSAEVASRISVDLPEVIDLSWRDVRYTTVTGLQFLLTQSSSASRAFTRRPKPPSSQTSISSTASGSISSFVDLVCRTAGDHHPSVSMRHPSLASQHPSAGSQISIEDIEADALTSIETPAELLCARESPSRINFENVELKDCTPRKQCAHGRAPNRGCHLASSKYTELESSRMAELSLSDGDLPNGNVPLLGQGEASSQSLQFLDFSQRGVSIGNAPLLAQREASSQSLQFLDFSQHGISNGNAPLLAQGEASSQSMHFLDFSKHEASDDSSGATPSPGRHPVRMLNLQGALSGERSVQAVSHLIQDSSSLEVLLLMDMQRSSVSLSVTDSTAAHLVAAVTTSPTLREVSLNDWHLGARWLDNLAKIFRANSCLRFLRISVKDVTRLNVQSAFNLVNSLEDNSIVQEIELYCNVQGERRKVSLDRCHDAFMRDRRIQLVFL